MTYVDFDCGFNFHPENPTKIRQIKRDGTYICRSCKKIKCFHSNDQHNCSFDEQHTSNIFLNPNNLWDMVPVALMLLNNTNDRDLMSNQHPQPTTHLPRNDSFPVGSSLRTVDSKSKGLHVSFAYFQRNYLPDGRVNETVARSNGWNSVVCDEL